MTSAVQEPSGHGSVSAAPRLPAGFSDAFSSRWVRLAGMRLHTVTGGHGPALLLLAGWPQSWYAWRELMPQLATTFTVVAPDTRGVGLSDKPRTGYDTATLASDMVSLMSALGHDRFAVVGHDVGMWIAYALAADHPTRVARVAMAEAVVPGLAPSPPLLLPKTALNRLFHFTFNRLDALNEQLVEGREHLFLGHQFATKAARPLPQHAVDYYIRTLARDRNALWACFEPYRAIDTTIEQNEQRRHQPLAMPVLAIAGAKSMAESVVTSLAPVCEDLASVILAGCGHYLAEEAPEEMLTALTEFLAPYAGEAQPAPY